MCKHKLLLFPFAGGNRYSYNQLTKYINPDICCVTTELPGRGERIFERLLTNMNELAEEVFDKLLEHTYGRYSLYGHSMGGLLAFLFARKAVELGRPPLHLFVSGKGAPSITNDDKSYLLPSADFRNKLLQLGGMPQEMLANESLMELLEPIIRADFQAIKTYSHEAKRQIDVPVTVMLGKEDSITMENAGSWQLETSKQLKIVDFPGGHFFIYDHLQSIGDLISETLYKEPEYITVR